MTQVTTSIDSKHTTSMPVPLYRGGRRPDGHGATAPIAPVPEDQRALVDNHDHFVVSRRTLVIRLCVIGETMKGLAPSKKNTLKGRTNGKIRGTLGG
jgi:hypothetical protein